MKTSQCKNRERVILILSGFVLLSSYYLQYVVGLEPCPLCLMQRLSVFLIFLFAVIGYFCKKNMKMTLLFFTAAGLFFALRQVWLLHFTSTHVPACLPGLATLIRYFPWQISAHALFWGSTECTEGSWSFLGLSLPSWSALYFLLIGILLLCQRNQRKSHSLKNK
jgi:disulfide bond formation protein DsbB